MWGFRRNITLMIMFSSVYNPLKQTIVVLLLPTNEPFCIYSPPCSCHLSTVAQNSQNQARDCTYLMCQFVAYVIRQITKAECNVIKILLDYLKINYRKIFHRNHKNWSSTHVFFLSFWASHVLNIQQRQLVESNDPYVTTSDMNYRCTGVCVSTLYS